MSDFSTETLAELGVCPIGPDDVLADLFGLHEPAVWACAQQIAGARRRPPQSTDDILTQLENHGLILATALLRFS